MTFHEHKIKKITQDEYEVAIREREEWNEAKPKGMLNVFQSTFSRSEMK